MGGQMEVQCEWQPAPICVRRSARLQHARRLEAHSRQRAQAHSHPPEVHLLHRLFLLRSRQPARVFQAAAWHCSTAKRADRQWAEVTNALTEPELGDYALVANMAALPFNSLHSMPPPSTHPTTLTS